LRIAGRSLVVRVSLSHAQMDMEILLNVSQHGVHPVNLSFRHLIPTSAAVVLLILTASVASAQTSKASIDVTLTSENTNLNGTDDVTVNVTMTNAGSVPVFVPKWYVPSEAATSAVFTITRNGEPVPYLGALVKRKAPSPQDFVRIAAGASLSFKVELSALYDLSTTGVYDIQFDAPSVQVLRGSTANTATAERQAGQSLTEPQMQDLVSNSIALTIIGDASFEARRGKLAAPGETLAPAFAGSVSFIGCSNTRITQISTALTSAESYASNALSYLNAGTRGARYTTWFGTYDATRYSTARSHFSAISNAASTQPLAFDCSTCPGTSNASAYAYVFANAPYRIYLCNAFWAAPNTGTDSRAGTIIHEVSHFTVVAGTSDFAYGQTAARSLARSNPARAVRNADSHEYFAENTPFQN
jgi:peptidyl-Lys metalloendopeptidase